MRSTLAASLAFLSVCTHAPPERPKSPITVFAAASLARPFALLADSIRRRSGIVATAELGGSLEQARKITELGRVPDVLMLVDEQVVERLMPTHLDWYVRFATNRIVVAYTAKSAHADAINADNWFDILARRDVSVGRADPETAPAGRSALSVLNRAESYYDKPGLTRRLSSRATLRYVRANATELAALLETGEVDYILDYESVARQYGFKFIVLPDDLATAVLYGISVPRQAPHFAEGVEFVSFVLSEEGKRILSDAKVRVLDVPIAIGSVIPLEISGHVRTVASAAIAR